MQIRSLTRESVILPIIRESGTILLDMQFEYEISVEDYAAAQVLYHKACVKGQFVSRPLAWGLFGLFFVLIAILRWETDWAPVLVLLTGGWFIYCAITMAFPMRHYRKFYPLSGLAGKKYHAELDANGLSVNGDGCSWRVPWAETLLKGEDKGIFMLCGKGTIFIFAKKYLTDEQQREIRGFAAIS
jgi:hypothetical protein